MSVTTIVERFAELGHTIQMDEVSARMDVLTGQFRVPENEAAVSVVSYFLRETGVDRSEYYTGSGENRNVTVEDIPQEPDKWVNLRVKLVAVWENVSEYKTQDGMIADETGRIKFVIWKNSGLPEMEEGKSYSVENVTTSLYNERISISFNKTSTITEIDEDIEAGDNTTELAGVMVHIKDGSGLIKRCPECNRALRAGACAEHGNVEGDYDMRIMAVLDDGARAQDILLNAQLTEDIWGHDLSSAIEFATESMDAEVVIENMRDELVGKYYIMTGSLADTMLLVSSYEAE